MLRVSQLSYFAFCAYTKTIVFQYNQTVHSVRVRLPLCHRSDENGSKARLHRLWGKPSDLRGKRESHESVFES